MSRLTSGLRSRLQSTQQLVWFLNTVDPADARREQLLRPVLWAALIAVLIVGPPWALLSPASERLPSLFLAAVAIVTVLVLMKVAGRGYVRAASIGLPTALLVVYAVALTSLGGIRSPAISGLFVVVVSAHVLLGERGSLIFAGLSIVAVLGIYAAETHGLVGTWPGGAGRAWLLITGQLAFVARLLSLTLQPMREGLAAARREQSRESERARELDALLQAHGALVSTLELDALLDNVIEAALAAIPAAEKGTVLLYEPEHQALQIRAMRGYSDARIREQKFVGTGGYAARTWRDRRPWLIPDAQADAEIRYDGDLPELRAVRSAISAPLLLQQETVGVISLDATRPAAFTESDLRLLVAFANTAALAISNAHLHEEVRSQAHQDALTGAANRRLLDSVLPIEVARAQRYGHPLSMIFSDIDSFKKYNDAYGHPAGDERLRAIAKLIRGLIRHPDLLARYGGEEFALLLPHTDKAGAMRLAERIRAAAEAASGSRGGPAAGFTLSLGVATYPNDAASAADLVAAADEAERAAKRHGKNQVCGAPERTAEAATARRTADPMLGRFRDE